MHTHCAYTLTNIYSFNNYCYYTPSILLGTEDIAANKAKPCSLGAYVLGVVKAKKKKKSKFTSMAKGVKGERERVRERDTKWGQ